MEKKRAYKPDTRSGPATYLIGRDGKITRRKPKHRPWNCAPKTRGNGDAARESYSKKIGEYVENYATVDRSVVKRMVSEDIRDGITDYVEATWEPCQVEDAEPIFTEKKTIKQ